MSSGFDIEKFSETAQKLTDTLEKSSQYINDVDQAMTNLYEDIHGTDIESMMKEHGQRLKELKQESLELIQILSSNPYELQEAAAKLSESAQQFGNSYESLQSFQEQAGKLTTLLEGLGHLDDFGKRLALYEQELTQTSGLLEEIRKQELAIQNLPEVLKTMKESVADLQKEYVEAADELKGEGRKARAGIQSIQMTVEKAENLQKELASQVNFFKIGIYALIVMNALMMVFVAVLLAKEVLFSS